MTNTNIIISSILVAIAVFVLTYLIVGCETNNYYNYYDAGSKWTARVVGQSKMPTITTGWTVRDAGVFDCSLQE